MHGLVSSFFTSTTAIMSQLVPPPPISPHHQSVLLVPKWDLTKCESDHQSSLLLFLLQKKAPSLQNDIQRYGNQVLPTSPSL